MTFVDILLIIAILGTGIVAGAFFAFSTFVLQGIDRAGAAEAARAMRGINVTAVRAPFMIAIFGTALIAAVLLVMAFLGQPAGATWWSITGAVLYLIGVVGVTGGANVPRNNALAAPADSDAAALAEAWHVFRRGWLAWNHVRTLTSTAACLAFVLALVAAL